MRTIAVQALGRLVFSLLVAAAVAALVAIAQRTVLLRDELVDAGCTANEELRS